MPASLTDEQLLIINLLLRVAVMAGIVSLVMGFGFMADFIVRRSATGRDRFKIALLLAFVFVVSVLIRRLTNQGAMDVSLEGTLLAGFIGGTGVGAFVGASIGLTCFLFGETVALPFYTIMGLAGGLLYTRLGSMGEIWSYSLNPFMIIYNFFEKLFRGRLDRNFIPFAVVLVFAAVRYYLVRGFGFLIYPYITLSGVILVLDYAVAVYTLGVGLKIAANMRSEIIVREEERQLIHARLATLRSQINPHFLFNTLNTISALIRTDAERAREMTRKLSQIFRKSLEDSSDIHSLRDEIKFIDDYLSIEKVRFGDEKLKVVKDVDSASLGHEIPSMILQPIVENAIKHGISRTMEGGTLLITGRTAGNGIEIKIENDGPEAGELDLDELMQRGMGLQNVSERLNIYACGEGRLSISGRPGGGVVVSLYVPKITEGREIIADTGDNCG